MKQPPEYSLFQEHKQKLQLKAIGRALQNLMNDKPPQQSLSRLLEVILTLTSSEYGFIDELFCQDENEMCLKVRGAARFAWTDEKRKDYEEFLAGRLSCTSLKILFNSLTISHKPIIANDTLSDPRFTAMPPGHPPLKAFLGIPLISGPNLIGVLGLANAVSGYKEEVPSFLFPIVQTCTIIINSYKQKKFREVIEAKLKESQLASEAANKAKTNFLAHMSHEIRSPISVMIGFSEMLRDYALTDSEKNKYVEMIYRNGQSVLAIINDLLDLSKAEANKIELDLIEFKPADLIQEVVDSMQVKASQKNLNLSMHFAPEVPKVIKSDPARLRQILMNLLSNAIKFTDFGSVALAVTANVEPSSERQRQISLEFSVMDTGCGIEALQKENLFKPFSQGDPSIARKHGGTGLGLCLSKNLAQAMGGDVVLRWTEIMRGSIFVATIICELVENNRSLGWV